MADYNDRLLDLGLASPRPALRSVLRWIQHHLDALLHFEETEATYRAFQKQLGTNGKMSFYEAALSVMDIQYKVSLDDLKRIPLSGPVFVVANHPFGGIDGIILGSVLKQARPDTRLLVNGLLGTIDGMEGEAFFVDPFATESAARKNIKGLSQSYRWLKEGHLLATFPSGTVSYATRPFAPVRDPDWAHNLAALVRKTGATVLPVCFPGQNSRLFQASGWVHPRLRTLLLARELMRAKGGTYEIRIGRPIPARKLNAYADDRACMDYLRLRTTILESRSKVKSTVTIPRKDSHSAGQAIAPGPSAADMERELAQLPPEALLIEQNDLAVYLAEASSIPLLLHEIGRCREITFRQVGEGTGNVIDLDPFDNDYRHLFIWNRSERELVGAYRLGLTDEILNAKGKRGLYTTTLFRFRSRFLYHLNPALELGRSFIVQKYQRKPWALMLLWKGIGHFVARHPKYRYLFGPVSISNDYAKLSKNLMVTFLRDYRRHPKLYRSVRPRHPMRRKSLGSIDRNSFRRTITDIDEVAALISEIEEDSRGVPVLLRQYLKLEATLLSFNIDPDFNDCLDGLVLVDLAQVNARTLAKYMGASAADAYLRHHTHDRHHSHALNPFSQKDPAPVSRRI